jgi:NitT/TauT family transport system substrate-binding protein
MGIGLEPLSALAIVAEMENFFSRRGVAATVRKFPSGKLAMEALLAGDVQVATVAETPVVFDSFARRDFRILAIIGTADNEIRIIARKDRGICNHGDLKGRRVATQEASSMHFFLHMFLVKHGLMGKEVAITYAPPDTLAGMLVSGQVDACSTREPVISRVRAALGENAVVFEEPGLFVKYYLVVAEQRFLERNPAAACAILRALVDAETYAKQHPRKTTTAVARAIKIEEAVLKQLWSCVDLRVRLSQSLLSAMEDEARWALGSGLVKAVAAPNYLQLVHLNALLDVKPAAAGIIR